ncbi:MAG: deaminase [Thermovirgaceae bacterium]|nr:deaminase [Thermovirgaceae bacterium]
MTGSGMVSRLLEVIEKEILPVTGSAVEKGHNIFGGAVLRLENLALVTAGTNMRADDPTLHGEIVTIHRFFKMKDRPSLGNTLFLATHEPCPMCLSALAWSGFKKIYFLFGYEETRDDFRMGDDLRMLAEVFSSTIPSRRNSFFELVPVRELVHSLPEREILLERIGRIKQKYLDLADRVERIRS